MMLKLKWITIAIALCLIITILTSFIPNKDISQSISFVLGGIVGIFCFDKYDDEVN